MSGTILRQVRTNGHRCYPPDSKEWPHGTWMIERGYRWEPGDLWRCDCGQEWQVQRHLWLTWERSRRRPRWWQRAEAKL